ncbi:hypothetical protein [Terriglobus albidus]|uniref:hypothetical protein n=1 Tax=Terriglobus albidus TaxID=1592106 RepID=UPI0021DF6EEC|nr:hypothetical protein [Terriglobus albidus]
MRFAGLPLVQAVIHHPRVAIAIGGGLVVAVAITAWLALRRKPSPEELERRRRQLLAESGRLIDGTIVEATGPEEIPDVLVYKYELAGVEYEAAQDVTPLRDRIAKVRWDLPVSIKYDPRNPGNSIVLAESWSGLRGSEGTSAGAL